MKCEEVTILIQRSLDQDLSLSDTQKMEAHLATCSECALFYERLQKLNIDLTNLPKINPPFSIVDSILPELERIDLERKALKGKNSILSWPINRKWIKPLGVVAASMLIIVTVYGLNQGVTEEQFNAANESGAVLFTEQFAGQAITKAPEIVERFAAESVPPVMPNQDMKMMNPESTVAPMLKSGIAVNDSISQEGTVEDVNNEASDYQPIHPDTPVGHSVTGIDNGTIDAEPDEERAVVQHPSAEQGRGVMGIVSVPEVDSEQQADQLEIKSPDSSYIAYYNQSYVEVKNTDSEIVYSLKAAEGESIIELHWIDSMQLKVRLQSKNINHDWVIDVTTGQMTETDVVE